MCENYAIAVHNQTYIFIYICVCMCEGGSGWLPRINFCNYQQRTTNLQQMTSTIGSFVFKVNKMTKGI